jgi:hypothetical protein
LTHDVDIVPNLQPESWRNTVERIWSMGGRPRIPETVESISDLRNVRRWIAEKGMRALSFRSHDGSVEIDLLVEMSTQFEELKRKATKVEFRESTYLIAAIEDLIAMKQAAGRPQDLLDIKELLEIQSRTSE